MDEEETIEERIKRYAYQRWEMRMHFKWKLNDTAGDDYQVAKELVEREIYQNTDFA